MKNPLGDKYHDPLVQKIAALLRQYNFSPTTADDLTTEIKEDDINDPRFDFIVAFIAQMLGNIGWLAIQNACYSVLRAPNAHRLLKLAAVVQLLYLHTTNPEATNRGDSSVVRNCREAILVAGMLVMNNESPHSRNFLVDELTRAFQSPDAVDC